MNENKHGLARVLLAAGLGSAVLVYIVSVTFGAIPTQPNSSAQKPAKELIADLLLQDSEVPRGWRMGGIEVQNTLGAEERFIWFYNVTAKDLHWVNFSEEPMIYSSRDAAAQAYDGQVQTTFSTTYSHDYKPLPEFETPLHADEIKSACLPININDLPVLACDIVARYQNVTVHIMGNVVEGRWLTMSDFQAVVVAVDQRITAVLSR